MAVTSKLSMSVRVLPTVRAPAAARKFARQAMIAWDQPADLAERAEACAGALTLQMLRTVRAALVVTVELDDISAHVRVEGPSAQAQRRLARHGRTASIPAPSRSPGSRRPGGDR
jgi:hypothetical protein